MLALFLALSVAFAEDVVPENPADDPAVMAEYYRLHDEMQKLAKRQVWSGVSRYYTEMEALGVPLDYDDYVSPIPEQLRWSSWAADPEGLTGVGLKSFIDNTLFPGLQQLDAGGDARARAATGAAEPVSEPRRVVESNLRRRDERARRVGYR